MQLYRSRAPVRISFAGGGTDVSPYPEQKGGCVLSAAINKYSFTTLQQGKGTDIKLGSHDRKELFLKSIEDAVLDGNFDLAKTVITEFNPDSGIELFFRNDVPPRSGLGSSAAGFVSLIGAFNAAFGKKLTRHEIAELAFDMERNRLKVKGGRQDQFASAYGGISFIEFSGNKTLVNPLKPGSGTLDELEKGLVLVFTGERKKDGTDIIAEQTNSLISGDRSVSAALDSAKQIAIDMRSALKSGDLEGFGNLLDQGWREKKKYGPSITTPFIDSLYSAAKGAGAIGGKITGAGGGGYMVFYCHSDRETFVREKLESLGAVNVPFSFDFKGLETWKTE